VVQKVPLKEKLRQNLQQKIHLLLNQGKVLPLRHQQEKNNPQLKVKLHQ